MDPIETDTDIIDLLKAQVEKLSLGLESGQLEILNKFLNLLKSFNEKVNLVSDATPEVVAKSHVLDCLTVADAIKTLGENDKRDRNRLKLIDIGSGAGFPGLIVAIALPQVSVVLVESIAKKARFLSEVTQELGLTDRVTVHSGRAEELARTKMRATFDFATARAVGHLGMVAELTMPFLYVGGHVLCQKSASQAESEILALQSILKGLGGDKPEVRTPEIQTGKNQHVIIDIKKIEKTTSTYPRTWSQIVKQWKQ